MPLGRRTEHAQGRRALADEFVDHRRNVELRFEVLAVLGEPRLEILLRIGEEVGREAEEVHRNGRVLGKLLVGAAVVEEDSPVGHALDLRTLDHRRQVAVGIHAADAARYGAVVRKGPVQIVCDHAVAVFAVTELRKVVGDGLVGFGAVEVVGVDDGERLVHGVGGHHHGMVRAPRLDAAFGNRSAFGQIVQLLKDEFDGDATAETLGRKDLAELLLEGVANDEYDLAETGADRVVNRIIDNGLVIGADPVHLLERAVARTHACGEDQ